MFRRGLIGAALAAMLSVGAYAAEVFVEIAPPHPRHERRVARPGAGYVWTPGYHRWDGHRYEWVGGAWLRPPHPRAHWEPAHWVRRGHGWVFVEGHWR